jgi:hypothetical protein
MLMNNTEEINKKRLRTVVNLAVKTVDLATNGAPDDLLAKPGSASELEQHNKTIESIVLSRLKNKFNM